MNFNLFSTTKLMMLCLFASTMFLTTSCDDDDMMEVDLAEATFEYSLHNGQAVPTAPYGGIHNTDFSVSMELVEMENGNTMINLTLNNTIDGETYHIHAHDAADAATTPNGTPYSETPNANIFAQAVAGNGGTMTVSQEAVSSFEDLTATYQGFFVVHDPLQAVSTTDITTYLVVGGFAREQAATNYQSATFNYDFNTGQVAEPFAYSGMHSGDLGASIEVNELADGRSRVTVRLTNAIAGETYHTHAHDMADPATTPNGTPYNEMPNAGIFAAPIMASGSVVGEANFSSSSFSDITTTYDGFFVVHDPLQAITTTDPTTYVVLGVFAR